MEKIKYSLFQRVFYSFFCAVDAVVCQMQTADILQKLIACVCEREREGTDKQMYLNWLNHILTVWTARTEAKLWICIKMLIQDNKIQVHYMKLPKINV